MQAISKKLIWNNTFEKISGIGSGSLLISKSIFNKINNPADPINLSFSHTMTFNKSFFKEILKFFRSKHEFFNSDIYNSTNEHIMDLSKAKSNNIKSAFIK